MYQNKTITIFSSAYTLAFQITLYGKKFVYINRKATKMLSTKSGARTKRGKICKSVPLFSKWETNAKMAIECKRG